MVINGKIKSPVVYFFKCFSSSGNQLFLLSVAIAMSGISRIFTQQSIWQKTVLIGRLLAVSFIHVVIFSAILTN